MNDDTQTTDNQVTQEAVDQQAGGKGENPQTVGIASDLDKAEQDKTD
jgi:hypothetical protein